MADIAFRLTFLAQRLPADGAMVLVRLLVESLLPLAVRIEHQAPARSPQ